MPNFIAINYRAIDGIDNGKARLKKILFVFDLTLRTLAIELICQYLILDKKSFSDPNLNKLILQKYQTLTLDSWIKIFFTLLDTYSKEKRQIFMPELYDLLHNYTDHSMDRKEFEEPFRRLAQIAGETINEKFKPKTSEGWNQLANEAKIFLDDIFNQIGFLENYDLIRVIDIENDRYKFELHKGLEIRVDWVKIKASKELSLGYFYWRNKTGKCQPLHPLFIFWNHESGIEDIGVYDKYLLHKLQYILALLGKTITNSGVIKELISLIVDTIEISKRRLDKSIAYDWKGFRQVCFEISNLRMSSVQHKFRKDLYLQRLEVHQSFNDFVNSNKTGYILIGEQGVGKSSFLLSILEEFIDNPKYAILMYDGAQIRLETSITNIINQDIERKLLNTQGQINDIWHEIANKFTLNENSNKRILLFIDAINENPNSKELLIQLDELVTRGYKWLKIIITSRPETWNIIRHGTRISEGLYYKSHYSNLNSDQLDQLNYSEQLKQFSTEELPIVYKKHKKAFDLKRDFLNLDISIREIIKDPFNLWLISRTYRNIEIPEKVLTTEIINDYLDSLVSNKVENFENEDLIFLRERIIPLMIENSQYKNSISIVDIYNAGHELYELIFNEQELSNGQLMNQSFVNLVDAGILEKKGTGRNPEISFKFERFYDFFIGNAIFSKGENVKDQYSYYMNIVNNIDGYPFAWGAIKNALIKIIRKGDKSTITKLSFTTNQKLKEMLVLALVEASNADDLYYFEKMLISILDSLVSSNSGRNGEDDIGKISNAKKIIVEVASNIGLIRVLFKLALDESQIIRQHTVRYTYYLLLRSPEEGFKLLENIVDVSKGFLSIPKPKALDFIFNFALLAFLHKYDNPSFIRSIRVQINKFLNQILYLDKPFLGSNRISAWRRKILLKYLYRQIINLSSKSERYFIANLDELNTFFTISQAEKNHVEKLLNYINPGYGNYKEFKNLIRIVADTNDAFATFIFDLAVITQFDKYNTRLLPTLKEIAEDGIQKGGQGKSFQVAFSLCLANLFNENPIDNINIIRDLIIYIEDQMVNKFHGKHYYRSQKYYVGGFIAGSLISSRTNSGNEFIKIKDYANLAYKERNIEFAKDIIWYLGDLAIVYKQWDIMLNAIQPLFKFENDEITEALIELLGRVRQYNPNQIDDFLFKHNIPILFQNRIKAKEIGGQENVIFMKSIPFIYHEMLLSPFLRDQSI